MKRNWLILLLLVFACSSSEEEQKKAIQSKSDLHRNFIYLSMQIRDEPPSYEEAQQFKSGRKIGTFIQDWMKTPEHAKRIQRYFWEIMGGATPLISIANYFPLQKNSQDVYFLAHKGDCGVQGGPNDFVETNAWWTDEPVRICKTSHSDQILFDNRVRCTEEPWNRIDSRCGCGRDLILCYDNNDAFNLVESIRHEFSTRGLAAYQNNWGWTELFGGDRVFAGDRFMYHSLLYRGHVRVNHQLPSPEDMDRLRRIPAGRWGLTEFPDSGFSAGVTTMTAFLTSNNNARSRGAVLTRTMLCQDVSSSLNHPEIRTLVNPDMGPDVRSHVQDPKCAACHYYLDNMSFLFNTHDFNGYLSYPDLSKKFYIFGRETEGHKELIRSIVTDSPADAFSSCMAKTAWESLTGEGWVTLPPVDRRDFEREAKGGPRALLKAVFQSSQFQTRLGLINQ